MNGWLLAMLLFAASCASQRIHMNVDGDGVGDGDGDGDGDDDEEEEATQIK